MYQTPCGLKIPMTVTPWWIDADGVFSRKIHQESTTGEIPPSVIGDAAEAQRLGL
jgi:hypothetical protein